MSTPMAKGIKRRRIDESTEYNTLTPAEKIRLYRGKRAREDKFTGNGHEKTKMSSSLTRIPLAEVLHSPAATRGLFKSTIKTPATITATTPFLQTRKFQRTTLGTPNYPASRTKPTSSLLSFTSNIHDAITKAKRAISDNRLDILRERREKPKEAMAMRRILEDRECELYRTEQERIRLWQGEQLKFFAESRKRREGERAGMFEWKKDDGLVRVVESGSGQSSL
ncbi:hypothetical protein RUND412_000440 [Rhizina undulata]